MAKKDQDPRLRAIGNQAKRLREEAGYSSAESFAYDKGLNRVQYWRMESGSNMQMLTFLKLCELHSISPEDFFDGLSSNFGPLIKNVPSS